MSNIFFYIKEKKLNDGKNKKIYFLGIPIYKATKRVNEKKKTYLGLLSIFKTPYEYKLRILVFYFIVQKKADKKICYFLLKFPICKRTKNKERAFIKKLYKKINNFSEYDAIYLYKHHIGEIYIYLNLLPFFIKKNKSKNPLLIVNEERYCDLYNIFLDNKYQLQHIQLSSADMDSLTKSRVKYKGDFIYNPTPNRFFDLRQEILDNKNTHFYNYIKDSLGLTEQEFLFKNPIPLKKDIITAKRILKKLQFKKNKFIIFLIEAVTAEGISTTYWQEMINELVKKGYKIFINTYSGHTNLKNCVSCKLSLGELYALTKESSGVISLISGAVVFLAASGVKIDAIYTKQTPSENSMTATQMLKGYTLKKIPYKNTTNICEYNVEEESLIQIKEKILNRY